ncbi:accessory Sec system protein Asp1 [Lactococcus petauri]|uniref:accessory Sec system protein Asp1 n=1 Tax=Lactococcus petauri TaxID=1940789 RepID=UPI0038534920
MVTFIPSWASVSSGEVSTDDLIGPIQALRASQEAYQLLIIDYLPNLRYFLHRFGLLESDYISIFDQLQGFENTFQTQLKLEDLSFPRTVQYVYTPFSILVYDEELLIGEVIMGEGAHISEVKHFQNLEIISIDVYDDRGFLSSRKCFEMQQHVYTEYLDKEGQCVFICFEEEGRCVVNTNNPTAHHLLRKHYESLEQLIFEQLEAELLRQSSEEIIFSVQEKNKVYISKSTFLQSMVLSYFDQRNLKTQETAYLDRFLISNAKSCMVDSERLRDYLISLGDVGRKVHKVSPFDTRFNLSISQEMKEEVLYMDTRHMKISEQKQLLKYSFDFICERMFQEESRYFKVFIRVTPAQHQTLELFYLGLIHDKFPEEVALIEEYGLDDEGENDLPDTFLGELKIRVNLVKRLLKSFEITAVWSDEKLFKILHETRLLIDLSPAPDLFTQIAGISSGIPQINRVETEYVQAAKNGIMVAAIEEVLPALTHYLDRLKYWQEARAFSVQQIKRYSGGALCHKILSLLREEAHE